MTSKSLHPPATNGHSGGGGRNSRQSTSPTCVNSSSSQSNSTPNSMPQSNSSSKSASGNPFPAMSLAEIEPELIAYGPDPGTMISIDHKLSTKLLIQKFKDAGLLECGRVVFITHGFWGNCKSKWIHDLKQKFFEESEDQTFVIVGWGKGAELPAYKYPLSVANVEPVAKWLGQHILEFKRKIGNKVKIWGIGEGIGAHLMGMAGRLSHAFARITGLDPAGPGFELVNESQMLRSTDSPFVDVVHTDSHHEFRSSEQYSLINKYGTLKPCGTLDIYVNYGYDQPNAADFTNAGSHLRAIELFAWSIENPGELRSQFVLNGAPEVDKPITKTKRVVIPAELGYHSDSKPTGNYYMETNGEEPWKEGF